MLLSVGSMFSLLHSLQQLPAYASALATCDELNSVDAVLIATRHIHLLFYLT